jgi:hypothetical protein
MVIAILPDDIAKKSDEEVLEYMHKTAYGSEEYHHCAMILQLRYMSRNVQITTRLVWATWGLVVATFLLFGVSLFQYFFN